MKNGLTIDEVIRWLEINGRQLLATAQTLRTTFNAQGKPVIPSAVMPQSDRQVTVDVIKAFLRTVKSGFARYSAIAQGIGGTIEEVKAIITKHESEFTKKGKGWIGLK